MKHKLIKLKDRYILISDEKIKDGDRVLFSNSVILEYKSSTDGPIQIYDKIIAGIPELPSVDFSLLSENDCKTIGWIDVEKLANVSYTKVIADDKYSFKRGYEIGFRKAQSLNKEFSLEDIKKAMMYGMYHMKYHTEVAHEEFIQSLQQTSWDVEVETELDYKVEKDGSKTFGNHIPKITDNSIKITKVL